MLDQREKPLPRFSLESEQEVTFSRGEDQQPPLRACYLSPGSFSHRKFNFFFSWLAALIAFPNCRAHDRGHLRRHLRSPAPVYVLLPGNLCLSEPGSWKALPLEELMIHRKGNQ